MEPKHAEGIDLDLDTAFEELEERLAPWGAWLWQLPLLQGETVHPY